MPAAPRSATFNVAKLGRQMRLTAVGGGAYLSGELRGTADLAVAWDYRRKKREIVAHGVLGPTGWDGERLWAETEKREARADAIYGRRIYADLPCQISHEARVEIVRGFAGMFRGLHGVGVEWSIHMPPHGSNGCNWHMHCQFTSRPISDDAKWAKAKVREWDTGVTKRQALMGWRNDWEARCNAALANAGVEDRVTLQSFATRGIEAVPQRHRGMKATDQARREKEKDEKRLRSARRRRRKRRIVTGTRISSAEAGIVVATSRGINASTRRDSDGPSCWSSADRPARAEELGPQTGEVRDQHVGTGRTSTTGDARLDTRNPDFRPGPDTDGSGRTPAPAADPRTAELANPATAPQRLAAITAAEETRAAERSGTSSLGTAVPDATPSMASPPPDTDTGSRTTGIGRPAPSESRRSNGGRSHDVGDRGTTREPEGKRGADNHGSRNAGGNAASTGKLEQPGLIHRIWHFITALAKPRITSNPVQDAGHSEHKSPENLAVTKARNRLASRRSQRELTSKSLAIARAALAAYNNGEQPEVRVMQVTPSVGSVFFILAVDLARAEATPERSVALCDENGVYVTKGGISDRSRSFSKIVDGLVEPITITRSVELPRSSTSSASIYLLPEADQRSTEEKL